ncbi:Transforming growth factor beta receptor type 3 [Varanus komodoensis]|nr:Transforming growth factor beta receptor type 3 [Varanus komodoensis]
MDVLQLWGKQLDWSLRDSRLSQAVRMDYNTVQTMLCMQTERVRRGLLAHSASSAHDMPTMCMSSISLNTLTDGASTTSCGSPFHTLGVLTVRKYTDKNCSRSYKSGRICDSKASTVGSLHHQQRTTKDVNVRTPGAADMTSSCIIPVLVLMMGCLAAAVAILEMGTEALCHKGHAARVLTQVYCHLLVQCLQMSVYCHLSTVHTQFKPCWRALQSYLAVQPKGLLDCHRKFTSSILGAPKKVLGTMKERYLYEIAQSLVLGWYRNERMNKQTNASQSRGRLAFESNFFHSYPPEVTGVLTELSPALGVEGENRKACSRGSKTFHCAQAAPENYQDLQLSRGGLEQGSFSGTDEVSAGSIVTFEKENFSLSAKIEEKPLPQGNKHLLEWAQEEYGAVTSFTELKISRNVYIKVGEDQFFPTTCNIEKNFISLNYLAGYLQPKAAEGCIVSSIGHEREVHIIELITPDSNPYSAFQVDIIIDIRPSRPDATLVRDLVLILKCRQFVNWVIKSHHVTGKLEVIVTTPPPCPLADGAPLLESQHSSTPPHKQKEKRKHSGSDESSGHKKPKKDKVNKAAHKSKKTDQP